MPVAMQIECHVVRGTYNNQGHHYTTILVEFQGEGGRATHGKHEQDMRTDI